VYSLLLQRCEVRTLDETLEFSEQAFDPVELSNRDRSQQGRPDVEVVSPRRGEIIVHIVVPSRTARRLKSEFIKEVDDVAAIVEDEPNLVSHDDVGRRKGATRHV
jgi:hypothetical protein